MFEACVVKPRRSRSCLVDLCVAKVFVEDCGGAGRPVPMAAGWLYPEMVVEEPGLAWLLILWC